MLAATIVLVIVTAIYAYLTYRISEATERSAGHAKEAAEASARAAAVAMAGLPIQFELRPQYRFVTDSDEHKRLPEHRMLNLGVRLTNRGANVHVHQVQLVTYYRATKAGMPKREVAAEGPTQEVLLHEGTKMPPLAVFRDDYRDYWSPTTWVPLKYVAGVLVDVEYSLDGENVSSRRVEWTGLWDEDFKFMGAETKREERKVDLEANYSTMIPPGESRHW